MLPSPVADPSDPPKGLSLPPLEEEKQHKLRADEALLEANRCLFCFDAPCTRACPTQIDVPLFIKKIASGNVGGAARTILSANVLGASCARVCPTEVLCEGACVLNDVSKPIAIGKLQRHATDYAMERGQKVFVKSQDRRWGSVGIIGAGPAGLACAAELLRLGHEAIIYEAQDRPGGLNTFGVAQYKMTPSVSEAEVSWLVQSGVVIKTAVRIGDDEGGTMSLAELEARHQAIFVGVGMGGIPPLGLEGEELPGVFDALDLIAALKGGQVLQGIPVRGSRVVVIGGGNTAIDVTTQAARAGAAVVTLCYRRTQEEMSAYAHEVELALAHGVRMAFSVSPVAVVPRAGGGGVGGLKVIEMRKDGASLVPLAGSERVVPADIVVRATGQRGAALASALFRRGIEMGQGGNPGVVTVDARGRTTNPLYWAGGDCISGGKEVVNAVAEGKRAAADISHALEKRTHG